MRPSTLILPLLLSLAACRTAPPVSPTMNLPPDTASVCATHCGSLGMDLGAVVIVRDSAGCVCQPRKPPASAEGGASASGSSAVAAGVVAVMDAEAAEDAEEREAKEEEERRRRDKDEEDRKRRERSQTPAGTKPGGSRR